MTLVSIGPVTEDLVIIGDEKFLKTGGATYYQSFVFEKYFEDYLAIVNCSCENQIRDFPDMDKVKVIKKDNTHFFINHYPDRENTDVRVQLSNFANIPIFKSDLKDILPSEIDAFILNPLNRYDFPDETIGYLKTFDVPVFMSLQGFLRIPDVKVNENYTIKLSKFDGLNAILSGVDAIFLDESEAKIIGMNYDVGEIVITDGSRGSRIISDSEVKIEAVRCDNIVDTTGCGDTYMAAYISHRIGGNSVKSSGDFASSVASLKLENRL